MRSSKRRWAAATADCRRGRRREQRVVRGAQRRRRDWRRQQTAAAARCCGARDQRRGRRVAVYCRRRRRHRRRRHDVMRVAERAERAARRLGRVGAALRRHLARCFTSDKCGQRALQRPTKTRNLDSDRRACKHEKTRPNSNFLLEMASDAFRRQHLNDHKENIKTRARLSSIESRFDRRLWRQVAKVGVLRTIERNCRLAGFSRSARCTKKTHKQPSHSCVCTQKLHIHKHKRPICIRTKKRSLSRSTFMSLKPFKKLAKNETQIERQRSSHQACEHK